VAAARGWDADLIVLGTHRRGDLHGLLVGSVGHQVAARIDTPILFVGGPRPGDATDGASPRRRILLAVDDSEPAEAAVRAAADLAGAGTEIRMVHALGRREDGPEPEVAGRELLGRAGTILEAAGQTAEWELLSGAEPVAERIARAADEFNADLIVLGSRRLTDFGGLLLGSVAHDVIHRTNRAVFLAEHPHAVAAQPEETREGTATGP
jgi:nucleotide-binding universal stress UspA family protein